MAKASRNSVDGKSRASCSTLVSVFEEALRRIGVSWFSMEDGRLDYISSCIILPAGPLSCKRVSDNEDISHTQRSKRR